MNKIIAMLFGDNQPAIAHYEIKFYTGGKLNDTWIAHEVHSTEHGYTFIDTTSGNVVTVSGEVKVTGILASNVVADPAVVTPAAVTVTVPVTPAV